MPTPTLRQTAFDAFMAGVRAADPEVAMKKALDDTPLPRLSGGQYIVIAVGKAACKMADTTIKNLPDGAKFAAVAVTNYENQTAVTGCKVFAAGHPVPDENGFAAAQAVIELLQSAVADDCVLACISGGSSAVLPAPVDGISLDDKICVNEVLLSSGFDITQMNLLRQNLSKLKGGGMLDIAAPAPVRSYILSDVVGDDLRVVGSGPTMPPIGSAKDAVQFLKETSMWSKMPASVQNHLSNVAPVTTKKSIYEPILVGGNRQSAQEMAAAANAHCMIEPLDGLVNAAAQEIVDHVLQAAPDKSLSFAYGGETTVQLTGSGKGGRNQELALRVAQLLDHAAFDRPWCFLSGGTDGRDGPTDAAGGLVDNGTVSRILSKGGNLTALLANNDSYTALGLSGDLLMTGATGTNVADIQLFLAQ